MVGFPLLRDPQDEALIVDEGTLLNPPTKERPPPTPVEVAPPAGRLTCQQLQQVVTALSVAAPSGFISIPAGAELLTKLLGEAGLPAVWDASADATTRALQQMDPLYSQYVSTAELACGLIAAAFPEILTATPRQLVHGLSLYQAADANADGLLTEAEWLSVGWWFDHKVVPAEQSPEPSSSSTYDRVGAVKRTIWHLFARPQPAAEEGAEAEGPLLLDYPAVMLHFCADRNLFTGIQKAVCLLANDPTPAARCSAEQVSQMAYPTGPAAGQGINRSPFDLEKVTEMVAAAHAACGGSQSPPTLTAEELMYSAACERLVTSLLDKYQWRDIYIAVRSQ